MATFRSRSEGRSSRGEATCGRCRLMVGQQLPTEIGWRGEHRGRGLTLNALVAILSASRARHADGPPHSSGRGGVLAFEAGCQDYCKGEIIEIEGKAARFTCAARPPRRPAA